MTSQYETNLCANQALRSLADLGFQNRGVCLRLQICVFKYARAVKQKIWNEAENRDRDWACGALALRARKTLTPRFTDFFTDFEKKTDCFAV